MMSELANPDRTKAVSTSTLLAVQSADLSPSALRRDIEELKLQVAWLMSLFENMGTVDEIPKEVPL